MNRSNITDIFKEHNGKYSFSRVTSFMLILVIIFVILYLTIKTHKVPVIPDSLVLLITGLYGVNRFSVAAENIKTSKESLQEIKSSSNTNNTNNNSNNF